MVDIEGLSEGEDHEGDNYDADETGSQIEVDSEQLKIKRLADHIIEAIPDRSVVTKRRSIAKFFCIV